MPVGCERGDGRRRLARFYARIPVRRRSVASVESLEWATRIFPRQSNARPNVRSILAATVFDTFSQAVLAGARGAVGEARNLVLRAEDFDIHVQISGEREQKQILVQI